MADGQQEKSPGDPDLQWRPEIIFHIPDISTDNWLSGHTCCVSKGCYFPSSPTFRLQTHIPALRCSRGVRGVVLSNQRCPDVNNIQTKTSAALISTSWFVSGSRKASVNNLEKKDQVKPKTSQPVWKTTFCLSDSLEKYFFISAAFLSCILCSCSCNSTWRWMSPDVIWTSNSSLHPPPCVFSSLMLRQSLISQANKRMEWAFPRWWQILIKC